MVRRYDIHEGFDFTSMQEDETGGFVTYDDYVALKSQRDKWQTRWAAKSGTDEIVDAAREDILGTSVELATNLLRDR